MLSTAVSLSLQKLVRFCLVLAGVALVAGAQSDAMAVSQDIVRKCRGDYKRLCPGYKTDSDDLRACMRSQHRSISNSCMNALVDAGEAPASARRR
jgi:hypothetical protein